jgi:predicted NAD/FAD-binding protein
MGIFKVKQVAVLGTGMAGFGAGYALEQAGVPFVCYDKNSYIGGHTRSFRYDSGFVFDEGGHISFTKHSHVRTFSPRTLTVSSRSKAFELTTTGMDTGFLIRCNATCEACRRIWSSRSSRTLCRQ